jgi:hypothetical protein
MAAALQAEQHVGGNAAGCDKQVRQPRRQAARRLDARPALSRGAAAMR